MCPQALNSQQLHVHCRRTYLKHLLLEMLCSHLDKDRVDWGLPASTGICLQKQLDKRHSYVPVTC